MVRNSVRALTVAAVLAASVGFAACGDDEEPTTPEELGATGAEGDVPSGFTDSLASQLEAAGIESDQASCVASELESTVGEDELAAAEETFQESGEFPQDILDKSIEAAQTCLQ